LVFWRTHKMPPYLYGFHSLQESSLSPTARVKLCTSKYCLTVQQFRRAAIVTLTYGCYRCGADCTPWKFPVASCFLRSFVAYNITAVMKIRIPFLYSCKKTWLKIARNTLLMVFTLVLLMKYFFSQYWILTWPCYVGLVVIIFAISQVALYFGVKYIMNSLDPNKEKKKEVKKKSKEVLGRLGVRSTTFTIMEELSVN